MSIIFKSSSILAFTCLFASCTTQDINERSERSKQEARLNEGHIIIATLDDPSSFDPRKERSLESSTTLRLMFDGLTRLNEDGIAEPAIAKSYVVSNDLKTYTFNLRTAYWSDGSPVTAQDFVETWKSSLSPDFPAPNAYQLYLIKGAKEMKEGKLIEGSNVLGVFATSPNTLVVELIQPTPYFADLVSCHFYFPVHSSMRNLPLNSSTSLSGTPITNGPFKLDQFSPRHEIVFVKNQNYWDAEAVNLNKISLQVLDERTALNLFESNEIDWAGSPLSTIPQDAVTSLSAKGTLSTALSSGTHWFRINTNAIPFTNEKIRHAFTIAINRKEIVDHVIQGNQQPAMAIVPPSFGIKDQNYFQDNDVSLAKTEFEEGLKELRIKKSELPKIVINYVSGDRTHKLSQTIQQQWNETFGIEVQLESLERLVLLDKMRQGNYQLSLGSWYADFQDPINFLEIFTSKDNPTNQTGWQNARYTELIASSNLENDPAKRFNLLAQAEKILMTNMPVSPIYFNAYNFLKDPYLTNVYFSSMGFLDFKKAKITTDKAQGTAK